jgi:cell fate regulator YaaT (PSP1 superfamily)
MNKKVGIRFKPAGKVYYFDCGAFVLKQGDEVIVETRQGLSLGSVAIAPELVQDTSPDKPLKKVFRLASAKDFQQRELNLKTEQKAHIYCLKCIKKLQLKMNLFAVESAFDASKLTFFFTSDGRVDFRQLVKMLVKELGVRIEMRQVGIRNQAKLCGGIGRCGRELCCCSFMEKFGPVSIRMAKEQGLSLNPTKISGQCGRLMCCLTFEFETYRALRENYPKIGKSVTTASANGKVIRHNIVKNRLTIRLADGSDVEISPTELTTQKPKTGSASNP